MNWSDRWISSSDEELETLIISPNQSDRHQSYVDTVFSHVRPRTVLDIGGGTGEFGKHLPSDVSYTVLDHPRMKRFLWDQAKFLPIGSEIGNYDLVVNTNSFGEMTLEVVLDYFSQITNCQYLYLVNRENDTGARKGFQKVMFSEFPLDNWKPLVNRLWSHSHYYREFLGVSN